ncbi:putative microtubule-actin cross-linking factor 1 [Triplophysa rosa]|uniref:Microtubule-actin cross-linking factor 1 n=1 Tax=Triplophysa rosa TaxID=992332 RepID=A0A9W7WIA9_TRIRA|nr:putative microtubule-actin cross-linking factor 1 [Triplophysa rosa]
MQRITEDPLLQYCSYFPASVSAVCGVSFTHHNSIRVNGQAYSGPHGPHSFQLITEAPGEMSSSDEESLSERSYMSERSFRSERSGGSLSPCAHSTGPKGDTLPWNLSKHERRKRKSQDSVLDPAERAVVRVAGRRFDRKWRV